MALINCNVSTDSNCIQINAPLSGGNLEGARFEHGQHIGHVARECAAELAILMDEGFENSNYRTGFSFFISFSYSDSNRSKSGYDVDLIVQSNNSSAWITSLMLHLTEKGFKPDLIV